MKYKLLEINASGCGYKIRDIVCRTLVPGDLFVSKLRSPMFTIFEPWLAGWLAGLTVEAVDVGRGAADLQLIHCSLLGDDLTR